MTARPWYWTTSPARWCDDPPARPMTHRQRVALVVALVVMVACFVLLALLPAAPGEPGFDQPNPTSQGAHTP